MTTILTLVGGRVFGQEIPPATYEDQLSFYLDCDRCDNDYIRRQIPYVNHVRDRADADVYLLVTTRQAAAGTEFRFFFYGRNDFEHLRENLMFVSSQTDSDFERQESIARRIKAGLVRYLARGPTIDQLEITFDGDTPVAHEQEPGDDPWDYWTFRVGVNGDVQIEETTDHVRAAANIGASRFTEASKLRLAARGNYREERFEIQNETISSVNRNGATDALFVKSLGRHWSVGAFGSLSTSTFRNTNLKASFAPALEFNIFPYEESSRREIRFSYFASLQHLQYEQITAFDEVDQLLLNQEVQATLEVKQPWGSASASLEASQYVTDFEHRLTDLYRLDLYSFIDVRIVRGLSLYSWVLASRIQDQIFLPRREASDEDILLGRIQLPTDFNVSFALGISYTFGSIYNNVVNPRFGP